VVALVGAQVGDAGLGGFGQFETHDVGGEPGGGGQVGHAGANVGDVGQRDHQAKTGARSM
jgi:hypothetical protein